MRCNRISELLPGYLNRELNPSQAASVSVHLAKCARCKDELAKIERVIHVLEQPVRQFDAPDMLTEIKLQAMHTKRVFTSSFVIRALAGAALLLFIIVLAAALPRSGKEPFKTAQTNKANSTKTAFTLDPHNSQNVPVEGIGDIESTSSQTKRRFLHPTKNRMHKQIIHPTADVIAQSEQTKCGARITIMDAEDFETSSSRSSSQASIIISTQPDSALTATHPVLLPVIAYRPHGWEYSEPYQLLLNEWNEARENRYDLP